MIDYRLIAESIEYYEQGGFIRIESPWTVSDAIAALTRPKEKEAYKIEHTKKCLVGSGEQSFLYLYNKGFLPRGKFQTVTPCFRDDQFSTIHTKYFLKNELIVTDEVNVDVLFKTVVLCENFLKTILGPAVYHIKTSEGYDVMYEGIELGSYGIRNVGFLKYIYATGLAEPRTSYCKNITK